MATEPHDLPPAVTAVAETGKLAIDDPSVRVVMELAQQVTCRKLALANLDRLQHFRRRALERGMAPADTLIVVLNGNDPVGLLFARTLMPTGWANPHPPASESLARGLVERVGMYGALAAYSEAAASQLRAIAGAAVLVVDVGHVALFTYESLTQQEG